MTIIGVDTGGTFTDFVYRKNGAWEVYKVPSTPENPARAILQGLEYIAGQEIKNIVHGSTVATNAILERKGANTVLVTNKGFEDIIEIGRQNRSRLYDLTYRREPHIVPGSMRFGIKGRVIYTGEIIEEPSDDDLRELAAKVIDSKAESAAVCLLFSFLNPAHEKKIKQMLPDIHVSLSHEIISEFREFERTSTTVVNAYISPRMERYISFLQNELNEDDRLRVMQSNGGSISASKASAESVRTILSGPAGGAVGAYEISGLSGFDRIISFDMGGTSTDVTLIDKGLSLTLESEIGGYL